MAYNVVPPDMRVPKKIEIVSGMIPDVRFTFKLGNAPLWVGLEDEAPVHVGYLEPVIGFNKANPFTDSTGTAINTDETKVYKVHYSTAAGVYDSGTSTFHSMNAGDWAALNMIDSTSHKNKLVGFSFSESGFEGRPSAASGMDVTILAGSFVLKIHKDYFIADGTNVYYYCDSTNGFEAIVGREPHAGLSVGFAAKVIDPAAGVVDQTLEEGSLKFFALNDYDKSTNGPEAYYVRFGSIVKVDDDFVYVLTHF